MTSSLDLTGVTERQTKKVVFWRSLSSDLFPGVTKQVSASLQRQKLSSEAGQDLSIDTEGEETVVLSVENDLSVVSPQHGDGFLRLITSKNCLRASCSASFGQQYVCKDYYLSIIPSISALP